jgi:hypothetical protein
MSISLKGTLDAIPIGFQHISLKSHGEHYVVGRPSTKVSNLIFGNMYIEHVGPMTVLNCKTGMYACLDFKQMSWTG